MVKVLSDCKLKLFSKETYYERKVKRYNSLCQYSTTGFIKRFVTHELYTCLFNKFSQHG